MAYKGWDDLDKKAQDREGRRENEKERHGKGKGEREGGEWEKERKGVKREAGEKLQRETQG